MTRYFPKLTLAAVLSAALTVGVALAASRAGLAPAAATSSVGATAAAGTPSPEPTPANPTAEDAARAAAQQLAELPAGVYQVACTPESATLPPYTVILGGVGQHAGALHILADGRCFFDPAAASQPGAVPQQLPGGAQPSP